MGDFKLINGHLFVIRNEVGFQLSRNKSRIKESLPCFIHQFIHSLFQVTIFTVLQF